MEMNLNRKKEQRLCSNYLSILHKSQHLQIDSEAMEDDTNGADAHGVGNGGGQIISAEQESRYWTVVGLDQLQGERRKKLYYLRGACLLSTPFVTGLNDWTKFHGRS